METGRREISSWLKENNYEDVPLICDLVFGLCDTLENLFSLKWEDIQVFVSNAKPGARRTLMEKIDKSRPALDVATAVAVVSVMPQPSQTAACSVAESTNSLASTTTHLGAKVQELLKKSKGRVIFGRNDPELQLSAYEVAMNEQAVRLLTSEPSLVVFSGTDVLRHAKTGALQAKARDSLSKVFAFVKGGSRAVHSAESSSSKMPAAITVVRVARDVRKMQLSLLPAKLENGRQAVKSLSAERDKFSRNGDFAKVIDLTASIDSRLAQLSKDSATYRDLSSAEAKSIKQRKRKKLADTIDDSQELRLTEATCNFFDGSFRARLVKECGNLRTTLGELLKCASSDIVHEDMLSEAIETCERLIENRDLRPTRNQELQNVSVPCAEGQVLILRVSPVTGMELPKYIEASDWLCKLMGHRAGCICESFLDLARCVQDSDAAGRTLTLQEAWRSTHDGKPARDGTKVH